VFGGWRLFCSNMAMSHSIAEREMRCVANVEVRSQISVMTDDLVLTITDPRGAFKARIKNIPRSDFTTPFLLSFHIYFEAPSLNDSKEIAEDLLATCLNMLAFTTGSAFRMHRFRQIVDAEVPAKGDMRNILMWGEYDDPQPFLQKDNARSIERLLEHDVPPAIRRALRWYRLGIDAVSPDDQFAYFWFALEIVAEFQKPPEKVHDKCPHCQSPLYCENCQKHPEHRPYAKQAIRAVMKAAECDDATMNLLDKTRNSLMHGTTLREIESSLPTPHESIVDILGRILWKALVLQFPKEFFNGTLVMGMPSTYIHYKANAIAHVQTIVPVDKDGHFNLDFKGMTVAITPPGPPQSAAPFVVRMTSEQYDRLIMLSHRKGDHQEMIQRIRHHVQEKGGFIHALVLATDMSLIERAVKSKQQGDWQDLFGEILGPADESG
jgi:hypothetical protein